MNVGIANHLTVASEGIAATKLTVRVRQPMSHVYSWKQPCFVGTDRYML